MKPLLAALLLAAPLAAQDMPDPARRSPEQHPGQLAQMRLAMLYPRFAKETTHALSSDPQERLMGFLADAAPVLKNARGLAVFLREGLKDPEAAGGQNASRWRDAWEPKSGVLAHETARLEALIKEGEAIQSGPIPAQTKFSPTKEGYVALEDKPEFAGPEGERLHREVVLAGSLQNLREFLIRKSRDAAMAERHSRAAERAAAPLGSTLP